MRRTVLLSATVLISAVLATAPAAPGAVAGPVVVGDTTGAFSVCNPGGTTVLQHTSAPGTPTYVVPGAGVLTSFATDADATAGAVRLVASTPGAGPGERRLVGSSPLLAVKVSTVNTFAVRIPVPAGTELGLYYDAAAMSCVKISPSVADELAVVVGDPTTEPSSTFHAESSGITGRRVNVSAGWEPDVDGDGYGDATQDLCPQSRITQLACPAPDTTLVTTPKRKSTKRRATIEFTSTVPGSTFTCQIDTAAAKPCVSPLRKRYRPGNHSVVVLATSPLGVVETAPAIVTFKVKRHRR